MIHVKTPTSEKSTLKPTAKVATSLRLRNSALHLVEETDRWFAAGGDGCAAASVGQPRSNCGRSDERGAAEHEKADAPTEVLGENSACEAAHETAQRGSADVEAHDESHFVWRPLFTDVGDDDGDDAGHGDALQKAPEDQLRE